MSFMEPEIFEDSYFIVETNEGTEFVPCTVCGLYGSSTNVKDLSDYLEGHPLDGQSPMSPYHGFVGRLSASGYTDCTPWIGFPTEQDVKDHLTFMYGDEDE